MRVAILGSRGVPAVYGGFEIFAENLGVGLVEGGCEVTVYCPRNQSYRENQYRGIYLRFVWHPPGGAGTLLYDALSLADVTFSRFDVVLMLGYGAGPLLVLPRLSGRAVFVNTDGLEWSRAKWPWYVSVWLRFAEACAVHLATALVSDSMQIQGYFERTYGMRSTYIPYGAPMPINIGEDRLQNLGLSRRGYYLAVMRLEPENSVEEIVEGFLMARTEKPLIIVGSETPFFRARILPRIKDTVKVRWLGPLELMSEEGRAQLLQLRGHAYAYVHGHTAGGTSPSLLQAMGLGTLVLAIENASTEEVTREAALFFKDASHLSSLIVQLEATSEADRSARRERLRQTIYDRYRWEVIVDKYLALFRMVCDAR